MSGRWSQPKQLHKGSLRGPELGNMDLTVKLPQRSQRGSDTAPPQRSLRGPASAPPQGSLRAIELGMTLLVAEETKPQYSQ